MLLTWTLEQEAVEVVRQFDLLNDLDGALRFVLKYIRENNHMINCAYDSIGRDELKRFLNHDFQSIMMYIIEQIERKEGIHADPDYKKIICNFFTKGLAGELVDLLKSRSAEHDEKVISCISVMVRESISAAVKSCGTYS